MVAAVCIELNSLAPLQVMICGIKRQFLRPNFSSCLLYFLCTNEAIFFTVHFHDGKLAAPPSFSFLFSQVQLGKRENRTNDGPTPASPVSLRHFLKK